MLSTQELLNEAESLPIEDRINLADSLLKTLNTPDPSIDSEWIAVAKRRLEEIHSCKISPVPGPEVFREIREHFEK